MEKEIKDILEKPFDPADIGKDYNKNAYVKPHLIIRRLNKAYDQNGWHFELLERIVEHDTIIQFGRLGIPNDAGEMVWKENCGARRCSYMKDKDGRPSDKRLDVGNDYKSAVSNCLKRCAMMHGIALDLYGDPEQSERTGADSSQKQKNAPNKPPTDGKQGKGTGSAEGGMKGGPSGAQAEALELQKAYMIAHGVADRKVRLDFLGTEDIPKGEDAWATYRDLMTPDDNPIGPGEPGYDDKSPGNLEDDARGTSQSDNMEM